jgi:hypothetical protein
MTTNTTQEELCEELSNILLNAGWRNLHDAQYSEIEKALPEIAALFRTPPVEQPVERMTDAEINTLVKSNWTGGKATYADLIKLARAIESHFASKREQPAGYVLDAKYEEAIAELAAEKDLSPLQVIKQALKLYQMHEKKFYAGCSPGPVPGYQQPAPQPDAADHSEQVLEMVPAVAKVLSEPFGYFRSTLDGWIDCAESDEGARPLYEASQITQATAALQAELTTLREQAERDAKQSKQFLTVIEQCLQMLLTESDLHGALFKAEELLRNAKADAAIAKQKEQG